MKEKTLLKIALVCVLAGIIGLWFISDKIKIEEKDIEKITAADVDKDIMVSGIVNKVMHAGKITIIEVEQDKDIKVVLFKENASLEIGDNVDVYGSIDDYKGEYEIIADVVRLR